MSITTQNLNPVATLADPQLKEALKAAFIEVMQERPDLIRDILEEALEDIGLIRAIKEGEQTEDATPEEVYALFQAAA